MADVKTVMKKAAEYRAKGMSNKEALKKAWAEAKKQLHSTLTTKKPKGK